MIDTYSKKPHAYLTLPPNARLFQLRLLIPVAQEFDMFPQVEEQRGTGTGIHIFDVFLGEAGAVLANPDYQLIDYEIDRHAEDRSLQIRVHETTSKGVKIVGQLLLDFDLADQLPMVNYVPCVYVYKCRQDQSRKIHTLIEAPDLVVSEKSHTYIATEKHYQIHLSLSRNSRNAEPIKIEFLRDLSEEDTVSVEVQLNGIKPKTRPKYADEL